MYRLEWLLEVDAGLIVGLRRLRFCSLACLNIWTTMAAMASSCCSSSSLAVQSIPSHGAISKSTTASLKALPALPALRRSGVTYGVPGAVKDRRVAGRPSALFGGEYSSSFIWILKAVIPPFIDLCEIGGRIQMLPSEDNPSVLQFHCIVFN